jgi:dihydrofolate reductase
VHCFNDLAVLDQLATEKTIWIAGGGEIYRQLLPRCQTLYLTRVHRTCAGDAYFPEFESEFTRKAVELENADFTVERWEHN